MRIRYDMSYLSWRTYSTLLAPLAQTVVQEFKSELDAFRTIGIGIVFDLFKGARVIAR